MYPKIINGNPSLKAFCHKIPEYNFRLKVTSNPKKIVIDKDSDINGWHLRLLKEAQQ